MQPLAYILLVSALLCAYFPAVTNAQIGCSAVQPAFCTNVDWTVKDADIAKAAASQADMLTQSNFNNMQGTHKCKSWYMDLMCGYQYPKCTGPSLPCKSECERMVASCRGAYFVKCNSFPAKDCYKLPNAASGKAVNSALFVAAVLISLYMTL